uniref:Uncharacterized protein n=1 Tax=Arundo donax TaxID=35708 RepID=A0A0A9BW45_ARUDO
MLYYEGTLCFVLLLLASYTYCYGTGL